MKEWSWNIRTNWEVFVWLTCTCWTLSLPFPPPGDLPDRGIELASLTSPASAGGFIFYHWHNLGSPIKENLKELSNEGEILEIVERFLFGWSIPVQHFGVSFVSFWTILYMCDWHTKKLCGFNIYNLISWETSIIYSCESTIYAMNISITWLAKCLPAISIISSLLFCDKNSQDLLS